MTGNDPMAGDSWLATALAHYLALGCGVRQQSRVLVVGCREGAAALYLAEWFGCSLVGVDPDPALVDLARARAESAGIGDRVRFARMDPRHLDLPSADFDAALLGGPTGLAMRRAAIESAAGTLRPGGRIGVSDLVLRRHPEIGDDLPRSSARRDLLTMEDYEALLRDLRLSVRAAEACHFLANLAYQPAREAILQGDRSMEQQRECREYDRIGHRAVGWGLFIAERTGRDGLGPPA